MSTVRCESLYAHICTAVSDYLFAVKNLQLLRRRPNSAKKYSPKRSVFTLKSRRSSAEWADGVYPKSAEPLCLAAWPNSTGFVGRPAFTLRGTVNVGVFEGPESVQHRRPTPPRGPLHLTRAGGERGYLYRPKMLEQRTPARLPARSHRARDGVQSQPRGRWDA